MLELLLSMHGNIKAVSVHGVNCLHLACQKNQLEMVKYLINTHKFSPTDIT
jgi:ankyrin repeat protein